MEPTNLVGLDEFIVLLFSSCSYLIGQKEGKCRFYLPLGISCGYIFIIVPG
jgi:hypothetical protein